MQNSMVMFTFSVLDWKYPFWANLVKKTQNCLLKLKFGTYNQKQNIPKVQKSKQNCIRQENFDICCCVSFDCYCQKNNFWRETGH